MLFLGLSRYFNVLSTFALKLPFYGNEKKKKHSRNFVLYCNAKKFFKSLLKYLYYDSMSYFICDLRWFECFSIFNYFDI